MNQLVDQLGDGLLYPLRWQLVGQQRLVELGEGVVMLPAAVLRGCDQEIEAC